MKDSVLLHVDESTKGIIQELENSFSAISSVDFSGLSNLVGNNKTSLDIIKQDVKEIKGKINSVSEKMGELSESDIESELQAISRNVAELIDSKCCQETLDIVRSQSERIAGIEAAGNNLQQISGSIKEEQDSQKQQIEMLTQGIQKIETELAKVQEKILSNQLKLESELSLILDMVTPFWKKKKTNK